MGYPHFSGDCVDFHDRVIDWGGVQPDHRKYSAPANEDHNVVVPKGVVTLCGSSRFKEDFDAEMKRLTLEGFVVISLGLFGHLDPGFDVGTTEEPSEAKVMLDNLHFRKIDLANRVHVINPEGYIGHSTGNEIHYAAWRGKELSYLTPHETVDPSMFDHDYGDTGRGTCRRFGCGAYRHVAIPDA